MRDPSRVGKTVGPTRAEAARGVEERLATTLHAHGGLELDRIPAQFLQAPPARPGEGPRLLRGGRLPHLGETAGQVCADVRELWEHAGCRVEETGDLLVLHDPAGYVITLTRHGDEDPVLTVASPPLPPQLVDRGLLAGLLAGVALGCGGPCAFSVGPMTAFPSLAGLAAPFWAWVPLFLLVGGISVGRPETRRFGAGLLLSGAVVGATMAGVFAT